MVNGVLEVEVKKKLVGYAGEEISGLELTWNLKVLPNQKKIDLNDISGAA